MREFIQIETPMARVIDQADFSAPMTSWRFGPGCVEWAREHRDMLREKRRANGERDEAFIEAIVVDHNTGYFTA